MKKIIIIVMFALACILFFGPWYKGEQKDSTKTKEWDFGNALLVTEEKECERAQEAIGKFEQMPSAVKKHFQETLGNNCAGNERIKFKKPALSVKELWTMVKGPWYKFRNPPLFLGNDVTINFKSSKNIQSLQYWKFVFETEEDPNVWTYELVHPELSHTWAWRSGYKLKPLPPPTETVVPQPPPAVAPTSFCPCEKPVRKKSARKPAVSKPKTIVPISKPALRSEPPRSMESDSKPVGSQSLIATPIPKSVPRNESVRSMESDSKLVVSASIPRAAVQKQELRCVTVEFDVRPGDIVRIAIVAKKPLQPSECFGVSYDSGNTFSALPTPCDICDWQGPLSVLPDGFKPLHTGKYTAQTEHQVLRLPLEAKNEYIVLCDERKGVHSDSWIVPPTVWSNLKIAKMNKESSLFVQVPYSGQNWPVWGEYGYPIPLTDGMTEMLVWGK